MKKLMVSVLLMGIILLPGWTEEKNLFPINMALMELHFGYETGLNFGFGYQLVFSDYFALAAKARLIFAAGAEVGGGGYFYLPLPSIHGSFLLGADVIRSYISTSRSERHDNFHYLNLFLGTHGSIFSQSPSSAYIRIGTTILNPFFESGAFNNQLLALLGRTSLQLGVLWDVARSF